MSNLIEIVKDQVTSSTVVYLVQAILFIILLILIRNSFQVKKKLPPSPPWLPIIGNLHQLGDRPHLALQSLSHKYGEYMTVYLGSKPAIIVSSAKAAREIMKTNDAVLSSRPKQKISMELLYGCRDVAAAPYGEYWRQMKSLCVLQLLSNKRVKSFRAIREEEMLVMVDKCRSSQGNAVNLSQVFANYTNDVICRVALGRKYYGDVGGFNLKVMFKEFGDLLGSFHVGDFVPWLGWIDRISGIDENCKQVFKVFDEFLERVVVEHLDKNDDGKVNDFVDVLLEAQRDRTLGFSFDRDSIKALLLDMFVAGTDTTSTVLEWAMTELLRNPRIMQKMQTEVRHLTGEKTFVSEDDLERMKYLKAVIKETLRLHPPIPLLVPREATHDLKLDGYDISAGTQVILNAWVIHRDPNFWQNPEEFNPERFIESSVDFKGHDFELIPFGGGRRICPGIVFAMASDEILLANLVHRFDWSLPDGCGGDTLNMSVSTGFTIHRQVPLFAVPSLVERVMY